MQLHDGGHITMFKLVGKTKVLQFFVDVDILVDVVGVIQGDTEQGSNLSINHSNEALALTEASQPN